MVHMGQVQKEAHFPQHSDLKGQCYALYSISVDVIWGLDY
jgi:hypothetical protein